LLTVSADTVYDLLQRGDLPGRKVGRKWLTTKTAVLKWLEQSATPHPTARHETALARAIAHGDTAALVDAVHTGKARLGTPHSTEFSGGAPTPLVIPLQLCSLPPILGHHLQRPSAQRVTHAPHRPSDPRKPDHHW